MDETMEEIAKLVEERGGLSVDSIGVSSFQKAIEAKMSELKIDEEELYLALITSSPSDFQELIDLIVVPESWFYRDKVPFEFLDYYSRNYLRDNKNLLKILSIPCSTGEEPYSIAITLLNAGLSKNSFVIDALDINEKSLRKAKQGSYSSYSFRNQQDNELLFSYFDKKEMIYQIKPEVSENVRFIKGNILDALNTDELGFYDIIFCRNLFIYLMPHAQQTLIKVLDQLLLKNGILIVAPSEIEYVRKFGFNAFPYNKSCAFQKNANENEDIIKKHIIKKITPEKLRLVNNTLEKAKQHADEGDFEIAKVLCTKYIHDQGPDPFAYYLLGLIEHAKGEDNEAEKYMLKTIYLEPAYYEALIYLALLFEKKGEFAHAKLYYNRAKKIESKQ